MATEEQSLESLVTTFLADLARANHAPQTRRAYASDLAQLCAFHQGSVQEITAEVVRTFFGKHAHLRPATRARKQAAVARFLTWAEQHDLLEANPSLEKDDTEAQLKVLLPALHPIELWEQSGRAALFGSDILPAMTVEARGGTFVLGPTHEEVVNGHGRGRGGVVPPAPAHRLPDPGQVP